MEIAFQAELLKIEDIEIIKIPEDLSEKLPSRGMVMVLVKIDDISFIAPLEPDGKGSHWLEVSPWLSKEIRVTNGESLYLSIEVADEWIEPEIPQDFMNEIIKLDILEEWNSITVKARWDWIRWIRSTKNPATRSKRINVATSKLQKGDKRPCCFDRSRCTITNVSKSGVLLDGQAKSK